MAILVSAVATKTTPFKDGPTNCRHQYSPSEPIAYDAATEVLIDHAVERVAVRGSRRHLRRRKIEENTSSMRESDDLDDTL